MHNSLSESLIPINSEKIQPLKKSSQTLTSTINTNKILFTPEMDNEKKKCGRCFPPIYRLGCQVGAGRSQCTYYCLM